MPSRSPAELIENKDIEKHCFRMGLVDLLNNLSWGLVRHPSVSPSDAALAVRLARKAADWEPTRAALWNTLGVAYYRARRLVSLGFRCSKDRWISREVETPSIGSSWRLSTIGKATPDRPAIGSIGLLPECNGLPNGTRPLLPSSADFATKSRCRSDSRHRLGDNRKDRGTSMPLPIMGIGVDHAPARPRITKHHKLVGTRAPGTLALSSACRAAARVRSASARR